MTSKLALWEKETIINFNEGEPLVNVYTYNKRWQRRMKEMGIKPIRLEGQAREYEFPKKWLRLPVKPKPRQFTQEQREVARKRMEALRKKQQAHRQSRQKGSKLS